MKILLRFCSVFNILAGLTAVLFCIGLGALGIALGGGPSWDGLQEVSLLIGPIGIAGMLYFWSGVVLWKSIPTVRKGSVILTGMAWVLCLVYCVSWCVTLNGRLGAAGQPWEFGDPMDEEVVMFVLIPAAMLLVMAAEIVLLWRKMVR